MLHRAALVVSATLAFSLAACQPNQALGLRVDPPATAARADAPLRGVRVAIGAVRDLRAVAAADDNDGWFGGLLGYHRDGLLQVRQFEYLATEPVEQSVAADLRVALVARGAQVVAPGEPADIVLNVDVLRLSITTDGILAGDKTRGMVALSIDVRDGGGKSLGGGPHVTRIVADGQQDPQLLGGAIYRTLQQSLDDVTVVRR